MLKPFLFMQLLLLQISLSAQVQWYQNQDGNNQFPAGTSAISVQAFNSTTFIACYLWTIHNDDYTWKISKTNMNGVEEKTFFITGITAQVEVKVGKDNTIYVLKKNYPIGGNPEYIIYKLNGNFVVKGQKTITFPNGFNIINLNAFETDNSNNVYLAGDGQYPSGPGFEPASFVLKTDKNLVTKWKKMDSTQTSFTRLHVDGSGNVMVLADFYTFFPDLHLKKISANGQHIKHFTIAMDPGRFSLFSALDDKDNLLLYGGKSVGETAQAMYLYKFSRLQEKIVYRKTHFTAAGLQLNDLKVDDDGNIFSLVAQYPASGGLFYKISRINSGTGTISWNHSIPYSQDSCNLVKLVVSGNNRFYAVGCRQGNNYFCKGFALRINKSGHRDGIVPAPDSVNYQRLHWLSDGVTDHNNRLIAIGGTTDLDTTTFYSSYLRAFAVRFNDNNGCDYFGRPGTETETETTTIVAKSTETEKEVIQLTNRLVVYPNPVTEQMTVTGLNKDEYNSLSVYNMQGAQLMKQTINGETARVDVNALPEGVYLLVLHSSVTLKEKNLKFIVRR
jgi:hypothetical protein